MRTKEQLLADLAISKTPRRAAAIAGRILALIIAADDKGPAFFRLDALERAFGDAIIHRLNKEEV